MGRMSSQPFFLLHQGHKKKQHKLATGWHGSNGFCCRVFDRFFSTGELSTCPLCFLRGEPKTNVFFFRNQKKTLHTSYSPLKTNITPWKSHGFAKKKWCFSPFFCDLILRGKPPWTFTKTSVARPVLPPPWRLEAVEHPSGAEGKLPNEASY